jgi:hypothetical protein
VALFDWREGFSTVAVKNHPNQIKVAIFQERTVLPDMRLAGWAALVEAFHIQPTARRASS